MKTLIILHGVLLALAMQAASAVTLQLDPLVANAAPGDTVSVTLRIAELGDFSADSLAAFDVDISFDSSLLTVSNSSLTSLLGDINAGEALDFSMGASGNVLNLSVLSLLDGDAASCITCLPPYLDDLQPGSFALAAIDFLLAPSFITGSSTIVSITRADLADAFGTLLPVTSTSSATINSAAAIPSPNSLLLLLPLLATIFRLSAAELRESHHV